MFHHHQPIHHQLLEEPTQNMEECQPLFPLHFRNKTALNLSLNLALDFLRRLHPGIMDIPHLHKAMELHLIIIILNIMEFQLLGLNLPTTKFRLLDHMEMWDLHFYLNLNLNRNLNINHFKHPNLCCLHRDYLE